MVYRRCSLFAVRCSLFVVRCSLVRWFAVRCSLFTIRHSPSTIRHSPFSQRKIHPMSHPLVLALFPNPAAAAAGARAVHAVGVAREKISVVSRNHDEEGALAEQMDATPGADIEDSRPAARFAELTGLVLAAIAIVLPGIGPIVTAGPLSAGLGEAAGHVAGGVASVLESAGVAKNRAEALEREVERGAVLLGVHAANGDVAAIREALSSAGATVVETANWSEPG
jgi:hypothetical protein